MKLIVASADDPAAENILAQLFKIRPFERCPRTPNTYRHGNALAMRIEGEATQMVSLPFPAGEVIVASRHASESGDPTLSVHVPGKLNERELAIASPATVKSAIRALFRAREELGLPHGVCLEATHHGPTELGVPVTFVEIGSSPEHWLDGEAGKAAARAIMEALAPRECKRAVGLGGPHYAPRHTEVSLYTEVGIGHILPRYADLDEELIGLAMSRTLKGVDLLAADWKGLNAGQRLAAERVAKIQGVPLVREGDFFQR